MPVPFGHIPPRCADPVSPADPVQQIDHGDGIAIDPHDWPKLRVVLEVFLGVGERDGLPEAAPSLTCNGIHLDLGGTRAAANRAPTTGSACATAA